MSSPRSRAAIQIHLWKIMLAFIPVGMIAVGIRHYLDPATRTVDVLVEARWSWVDGQPQLAPSQHQPGVVLVNDTAVELSELGVVLRKQRERLEAWGLKPELDVKYNLGIHRRAYLELIIAEKIAGFEHVTRNYITTRPESIEQPGE